MADKFRSLPGGPAFYVTLVLCLAVAGVGGYFLLLGGESAADTGDEQLQTETAAPVTDLPEITPEAAPEADAEPEEQPETEEASQPVSMPEVEVIPEEPVVEGTLIISTADNSTSEGVINATEGGEQHGEE